MDWRILQTQKPGSAIEDKEPSILDLFNSLDSVSDFFRALGRLALITLQGLWSFLRIVLQVVVLVGGFLCSGP